ncbi:MAG: hypothetical protein IJP28_02765, partial [Erysipelotrichales bacterium]|nr:hypothetical protein [Erysipelotrichales bacterium]
EYPSVYMITYFLLTNHPHHTTTLQHILTYILTIELLTTFLPFTHTHYLMQIPAHLSIPSLLFIFLFSILLLFTKYTKILTHYSQVSLHIPHHIITGLGYKDSGNVALVDQRPLLFLKYEPLLEEHFTHAHSTHVSTIEGEHEVKCIGAEVYIDQRYKGECYVAMVHFDEVYDVILNARI